jgi:MSHA biogenesis protein MshP
MSLREGIPVSPRAAQRGFSVMLMLGIIVLMGGMLAYAVSFTSGMNHSVAQEAGGLRVTQAANAGLEWARYRVRIPAVPSCVAITNLTIPLSSGAGPVTVRCTATGPYPEGVGPTVTTYQLSATACSPAAAGTCPNAAGAPNYVERTVTGLAER